MASQKIKSDGGTRCISLLYIIVTLFLISAPLVDPDGDDTIVIPNSQPASGIVDCSDTTDEDGTVILWDLVAIG